MRDWILKKDMNFDGVFSISDIWLFLKSLYFYPGDYLLKIFIGTDIGNFFEFTTDGYGGFFSGIMSFFIWLMAIGFIVSLLEPIIEDIQKLRSKLNKASNNNKNKST